MNTETALALILAAPLVQALLVMAAPKPAGLRDLLNLAGAALTLICALVIFGAARSGEAARLVIAHPLPRIDLAFSVDPLGALMAALVASLGLLHAAHTIGFVRATQFKSPTRLMALIAIANLGAIGVALSANLLSFFIAYQVLVMAGFPLVALDGEARSRAAARRFLSMLLAASMGMLLPALVWTHAIAGPFDFQAGGALAGLVDPVTAGALLALFVLGIAASAMPPLHAWADAASRAPDPALTSIYTIAIMPAGCIGVIKVAAFVFGPALADAGLVRYGLVALAGAGMVIAAMVAIAKQDVRDRLAYSCMAQALAAVVGALLALPAGLFAAVLQVLAMSCAAATMAMAIGTVAAVTHRRDAQEYVGMGRAMPWTFASFALGAASMIGLPPFAGAWAKLWLITASAGGGMLWTAALVAVAATFTFMHFGPLAANALAARAPPDAFKHPDGASFFLVAPAFIGAIATLSLLAFADPLATFLSPIWTPAQ